MEESPSADKARAVAVLTNLLSWPWVTVTTAEARSTMETLTKAEHLCHESSVRNLDDAGDDLLTRLRSGDLLLCIDRAYARRFIERATPEIVEDFGLNLVWSRRVVWSTALLRAVAGAASAVIGFVAFGPWWGLAWLIALPVVMARMRSSSQLAGGKLSHIGATLAALFVAYSLVSSGLGYPTTWGASVMALSLATIYVYAYPATVVKRLIVITPGVARVLVDAKAVWVLRPDEI